MNRLVQSNTKLLSSESRDDLQYPVSILADHHTMLINKKAYYCSLVRVSPAGTCEGAGHYSDIVSVSSPAPRLLTRPLISEHVMSGE